jgi:hypothetical protein
VATAIALLILIIVDEHFNNACFTEAGTAMLSQTARSFSLGRVQRNIRRRAGGRAEGEGEMTAIPAGFRSECEYSQQIAKISGVQLIIIIAPFSSLATAVIRAACN